MVASTPTRRAVNYGRLSSSAEGIGVDGQLAEGRRIADRESWSIVGEYRDDGISASRYAKGKHRGGWLSVMEAINAELRRGDVLIVKEISRASRDRQVSAALLAACGDNGVFLCVGGKLHDPNDPDDAFMLDLQSALAVRESGVISRRVKSNVDLRVESGRAHGRLHYGFKRIYSDATGKPDALVPDPETAPIVQEIARRILAGDTLYEITADLNRRGVPSPLTVTRLRNWRPTVETPWMLHHVRRISTSPTIAGLRKANGKTRHDIEVQWEPLITRDEHARLVDLSRGRGQQSPKGPTQVKYLLSYIATCGVCSGPLYAMKNNTTPSYGCHNGHVARRRDQLDAHVTLFVLSVLCDPSVVRALSVVDDEAQVSIDAARVEAEELRASLDDWYAAAVAGSVTPTGLAKVEEGLLARIADAERRAIPRPSSPVLRELTSPGAVALEDRWRALPIVHQREALTALFTIVVHRTRRGRKALDPTAIDIALRHG